MKSTDVISPTPLKFPIAYNGLKNNIPLNPTGSNLASITEGFPQITMKSVDDGGLPPYGQDFNGLFYNLSTQTAYLQNGGFLTFVQSVSDLIGGYPQGAILDYYDANSNSYTKVISLIEDNTNNFVQTPSLIDGVHWGALNFGGANQDLSNLTTAGINKLHTLKGYLDNGTVLADTTLFNDVYAYNHSTFDLSKFTITGTPTITDNGIITSADGSNYAQINFDFSQDHTFEIEIKGNASTLSATTRPFNYGYQLYQNPNTQNTMYLYAHSGNTSQIANIYHASAFKSNFTLKLKITKSGLTYTTQYWINGEAQTPITTTLESAPAYENYIRFQGSQDSQHSVDLKSLSIRQSGIIVFSGNKTGTDTYTINGSTVLIPYTLSSTGSKIVDSAYRTAVESVYEQEGSALYYTIDETNKNVTLPMGELYGFIEENKTAIATKQTIGDWCITTPTTTSTATQNKPAVVVENYAYDNFSGCRVWSDGMIEQWGFEVATNQSGGTQTVNLFKPYSNDDYCIMLGQHISTGRGHLLGTTAVTTSSFTLSHENANDTPSTVYGVGWRTIGY